MSGDRSMGVPNLQRVYQRSGTGTPNDSKILCDATVGGFVIENDSGNPIAHPDALWAIRDVNGDERILITPDRIDFGVAGNATTPEPLMRFDRTAANSLEWWPTTRTFSSAQGSLMAWTSTAVADYANVSIAALNLQGTFEHSQAGFPFNHALLFNHGATFRNTLNVAANYGPVQGFIDQPAIEVNRTSAGTVTMGLFRSFLSQPRFQRTSSNGTLSITTAANVQCFGAVSTGATIGTFTRVALGPFTDTTGTVTTLRHIDIADEPGVSNEVGIRIQTTGTGARAIEVTGSNSPSTFAAPLNINNGQVLVLGSVGTTGVINLTRTTTGTMRMRGTGATFNEALEWNFELNNIVDVASSTGAGIRWSLSTMGFFSTVPVTQRTDPGALTDSTGGTVDGTLAAIAGSGADAAINDNFADLANRVNALRAVVSAAAGGVGLAA